MRSSDIYNLVVSDITGNDTILLDDEAGILCKTWELKAAMPMQLDIANTERTSGRVVFTDMHFTKMSDISDSKLDGMTEDIESKLFKNNIEIYFYSFLLG